MTLMAKKRPTRSQLAQKLAQLRDQRGLTQIQAAELLGVSSSTWIAWENDQRVPGRLTKRLLKATFPELKNLD